MTETKRNQKDQLAKLMATENITIVHKPIPTAYFDVKNRILACPTFKDDISNELYDLFMGHEVGHALNTPYEGLHNALTKNKTLKGYLNVVEDVRIEKAIKNKFQGLRKSFYTAYNELMEKDFFGLNGRDLNTLSCIDKINLITKCGSRVQIALTEQEQTFLEMAEACTSWEDVEVCAEAIYNWSKENEVRDENDESIVPKMFELDDEDIEDEDQGDWDESDDGDEWNDDTSDSEADDEEETEDSLPEAPELGDGDQDLDGEEDDIEESESEKKTTGASKEGGVASKNDYDGEGGARESLTEHHAHNNEEMFIDDKNVWREQINLRDTFKNNDMNIVVGHDKVLADWKAFFKEYSTERPTDAEKNIPKIQYTAKKLIDKNKKLVAHMAKEFEMKQTAQRSVKAFSGKTGKLDMNKLAKYQIVDDVFKRVTYLPDGQNHGLNVLLDWSGSIGNSCAELLEQAIILSEFCRKANIPHRVYLFTDAYNREEWTGMGDEGFLVELFSNEMNNKKYREMMNNVASLWMCHFLGKMGWRGTQKTEEMHNAFYDGEFAIDSESNPYFWFDTDIRPMAYRLGGTPLDHCLVAMRKLLPEFNSAYGIEKSILTVITDGFSHGSPLLNVSSDAKNEWAKEQGIDSWGVQTIEEIIDPYSNKVFPYGDKRRSRYYNQSAFQKTQNLLSWISKTCNVTITGYFVLDKKRDMGEVLGYTSLKDTWWDNDRQLWSEIRKNGLVVDCHGYNKMFLTATSSLGVDGSDELDNDLVDAKKSRVMAAFKKNQKAKTTSRFLTNEFIKEIS